MSGVKTRVLPVVDWLPTQSCGRRYGAQVRRVVLHRWAANPQLPGPAEVRSYRGVLAEFLNPANRASAHFVYPGASVANEITQMVSYADYAWTEAAYNPTSVEIECADAIWLGHDPDGFEQLAHITGFLLRHFKLPPVWSTDHGFCRHADLGAAGGGHTQCPTTNIGLWRAFVHRTQLHYQTSNYRPSWGV